MPDSIGRRPLSRRDLVRGAAVGGAAAAAAIGGSLLPGSMAAASPGERRQTSETSRKAAHEPAGGNQVGGLPGWLGSVVKVANVAAKMLPLALAGGTGGAPPPFRTGGIQFEYLTIGDQTKLYAHNISGEDTGLAYSLTRSEPAVNLSVYQPLPINGAYPCQQDLQEFVNGQVYLAPTPTSTAADGTPTRAISFAVRGLSIAASVNIIGGIRLSVNKDPGGESFTAVITTTGVPRVLRAQIAAAGPDGDVVRAQWDASTAAQPGAETILIALPVGVDLDPVVQSLELLLELDLAGFDLATADRLAQVITIST